MDSTKSTNEICMYKIQKLSFTYALLAVLVLAPQIRGQELQIDEANVESESDQSLITTSEKELVVGRISQLVKENYVFPKVGAEIAEQLLNNLKKGNYTDAKTKGALAKSLTNNLRAINGDKHLSVWVVSNHNSKTENGNQTIDYSVSHGRFANYGFTETKILSGNVGYVRMSNFSMDEWYEDASRAATRAMEFVSNTDALIFDLRGCPGGGARLGTFLASYLFGSERVHFTDFYIRVGDRTIECWTEAEVPGKKMPKVPVRILIDENTFSSAEGFAYSLKHLGRAKVVGQASAGGAHGGSSHSIPGGFELYIPFARSIHPVTKTDFEGVGVKPDVEVQSNHALLVAHYLTIQQLQQDNDRASKAVSAAYEKVQKRLSGEIRQHSELIKHISDQPTISPNVRSLDSNK